MRSRSTRVLVVILAVAVGPVACSSGDDDSSASTTAASKTTVTTAAPSTTIEAPTTTSDQITTTTAPAGAASFANPTAAGTALFAAWTKGDRAAATALNLAPAAELDKLFASPALPAAKNRGCDDGDFGSASCFFGNGDGGVNIALAPSPVGWTVTSIDPFA